MGQVFDKVSQRCIIPEVFKANNAWERARGLLARKTLDAHQGFWLEPCPSVHTIGMRYDLDIIFLDNNGQVNKVVSNLRSMRFAACSNTKVSLELIAGQAANLQIETGMQLLWKALPENIMAE